MGGQVVVVQFAELPRVRSLAVEELNDPDTREALLQEGVDAGQAHADVPVGRADP